MRRAALWLFFIMIVSYAIAFSAVDEMDLNFEEFVHSIKEDNVLLFDDGEDMDLKQEALLGTEDVSQIEVVVISSDVKILTEERTDVFAELRGSYKGVPAYVPPKLEMERDGNVMNIRVVHQNQPGLVSALSTDLTLIVPEQYKNAVRVRTTSGDVEISYGAYRELDIKTVSGEVELEYVSPTLSVVQTTSGDIEIERARGGLEAESVSGDIDVRFEDLESDVKLKSTSGEVKVALPMEASFKVDFKSTSGRIETTRDIAVDVVGDHVLRGGMKGQAHSIDVRTVSGDISLR